ncbi:hypothetical protein GCM10029964_067360 [Kibdelosporangium lantanae]
MRSAPFPVVSFAVTFHEPLLLEPGERLAFTHHAVIADGAWDTDQIETYLAETI